LNFHGVVLPLLRSDGLGSAVKEELLSNSVLSPSSKPNVVGTVALSNSLHWKFRSQVEWSITFESKALHKSFVLNLFSILFIDNFPSLVGSIVSVPNNDWSSFFIFASINIKTFGSLLDIAEVFFLVGEDLPPLRVSAPDLHVVGLSRALDVE
jgi:hypothetical protein